MPDGRRWGRERGRGWGCEGEGEKEADDNKAEEADEQEEGNVVPKASVAGGRWRGRRRGRRQAAWPQWSKVAGKRRPLGGTHELRARAVQAACRVCRGGVPRCAAGFRRGLRSAVRPVPSDQLVGQHAPISRAGHWAPEATRHGMRRLLRVPQLASTSTVQVSHEAPVRLFVWRSAPSEG